MSVEPKWMNVFLTVSSFTSTSHAHTPGLPLVNSTMGKEQRPWSLKGLAENGQKHMGHCQA